MPLPAQLKKTLFISGVALWLGAAAWGTKQLNEYSFGPGERGESPVTWPADARFSPADGVLTLVVALHPECPCSRATLSEIDAILAQTTPSLRVFAVFLDADPTKPAGDSALFKTAHKLPGVSVIRDRDGANMKAFNFLTSGETRLYLPDGSLVFRGGVTASRGHAGENPGRTAVIDAVRASANRTSSHIATVTMPAFGCALFDSSRRQ
jgi:hypothetical protein